VGFKLAVVGGLLLFLGDQVYQHPELFLRPRTGRVFDLVFWTLVIVLVELLPVSVSKTLQLSLSYPVLLAVAILYDPAVAGVVALVGSFDSRELRRELPVLTSLFNRCQIALCTVTASLIFHGIASVRSPLYLLLPTVIWASASAYGVNIVLVTLYMRLVYEQPFGKVLSQLRLGAASQFLLNYLGLGLIGVVIARLYADSAVGLWSVAAFVLPLVFARQMFFRTMALEEAGKELKDREQVLRALSNRMAEERQDERMQIAAYLHDDLAQMLFRLNLQVEMAKKRLAAGELNSVLKDLEGITSTKDQTSNAVRALIRDLHRSPIGRKGLAEAVQSFGADVSKGSRTRVTTDVVEVSLPPPIQLLIYQIAREAAMNALKHAEAENIWISLHERDDGVELQIRDDGKGFDTEAPPPEGHFGSVMMRERAQVAGGTFSIQSEKGQGTIISAGFPRVWVEEGSLLESLAQPADGDLAETQATPADDHEGQPRRLFRGFGRLAGRREAQGAGKATAGKATQRKEVNGQMADRREVEVATARVGATPDREPGAGVEHPDPDQPDADRRSVPA